MASLSENNSDCAVSKQTICNARAKIKKKRMEGCNTVEERKCEENNILSDIIVVHLVSILTMRTWPFVLIMDTTYKTNKYNMLLLEAVRMTPTRKTFTVANTFMRNEKAEIYKWVLQQLKNLYFESLEHITTNRAESEHSLLKAWIATRHDDLDTVFLKINSLIKRQITEIKSILEYSRLKEKDNDESNPIIAQLCYNVSHQTLKIIKDEIKRAPKILANLENLYGHWDQDLEQGLVGGRHGRLGVEVEATVGEQTQICHLCQDRMCGFSYTVCRQIWTEMHEKQDMYWNCFGGSARFYKILHGCVHWDSFAPRDCWMDVHDHLIPAANTLNLCILLIVKQDNCTVLPFYSSSDQLRNSVVIGHLVDNEHFIAESFFHLKLFTLL
ncbi:hypothetical protein M9H77_23388 [Catharanthus roseus]|uniref:Uncharacterized protein n=1 Tax=Catharanthus roseus TaxID=4058 RepID=A0ACC0AUP4_CATRO|nr:hypothetical protein M9H77_23388 [Catharanthus roseus]